MPIKIVRKPPTLIAKILSNSFKVRTAIMGVTVSANGLSIVHQGSGGEANADIPDICLTQCGPPVVPIPYGNNAKSADLADGTTTITMDGGNSVAIKGSKFSKSTGDSGGDKKGVASGTIEGEAEFISASPTVKFEGAGVCRLSDQMTMNKANTMCLGGAQNPSVSVTADAEGTYTVDVKCRYPDGTAFKNADFDITDASGGVQGSGSFNGSGSGSVSGLKPGSIMITAQESNDEFVITQVRQKNPYFKSSCTDEQFFEIATNGQQAFWQPERVEKVGESWGSMGKSLTADPYFSDMVRVEVRSYFDKRHPDFTFDAFSESIIAGIESRSVETISQAMAYGLPMVLEEGEILSVLLRLPTHETIDNLLAYMRARGKGNPQSYLSNYDWESAKKSLNTALESILKRLKARIDFLKDEASRLGYDYLASDILSVHSQTVSDYTKTLTDLLTQVFDDLKSKSDTLMSDVSAVRVIQASDNMYSAEAQVVNVVVNAALSIDLQEQQWVKIRAIYDDHWQTPLPIENLKVVVNNDVVHEEKVALSKSATRSSESETKEHAIETHQVEGGVKTFDNLKPNAQDITIEAEGEPNIEKDIEDLQSSLEASLDGMYNALVNDMAGFQKQWDEEGYWCLGDGVVEGAKSWGSDLVEMFTPRFWSDAAETVSEVTSSAVDKLAIYAVKPYDSIRKTLLTEDGHLKNPTWILQELSDEANSFKDGVFETIDDAVENAKELYADGEEFIAKLECMAKYKKEILELPKKIAEGDVNSVEHFIDTVLFELDEDWAREIKESENYPKALAIIADHDSALTYLTYLNLITEAIPPNFYSYYGGKAGTYIALEIALTSVLAVCTLGAGAAARIATLTAKFAAGARKVKTVKNLSHAAKALDTFIDTVKSMIDILSDYQQLAEKLLKRPLGKVKGKSATTMTMKKKNIERDAKCRLCHSKSHKTPRYKRGELDYI